MTDKIPPLPEGFALEEDHPPLPEGFKLESPAGDTPKPSFGGKVMEETRRAIAKADRDYIVPMLGLPADIVGWALDTENDLPGSTNWWKSRPGIGNVPEPATRAGKLGAEVLGQGTTGLVQGGALGKTVQAGGQALGALGKQATSTAMSKIGGQIADPKANVASALGSAAVGQGLESVLPEGMGGLAHGVGSVLGGAVGGGFVVPPRAASSVDKAFEAYERLGLSPSAAMVGVGGRTAQVLEGNVLPSALGSAGRMHNFAAETRDKFQSIKDNIASQFGAARTKYGQGKDIQETVAAGFQARKKEGADILEAVGTAFGPNDRFIPKNLNNAIFKPVGSGDTMAVQKYVTDPEIGEIKALLDETSGSLTYADMLAVKSKLGNKLEQSHALPVDKAQISQLVSAIDNDMKAAVTSIGNPDTVRDWEHGKAVYNNAMRDYEKSFKELLGTKDLPLNPEAVYRVMMGRGDIKSTADIESFETVWRQLGKAKQGELASTVLTHMGNTDPEKIGSVDGFSLPTFLTQYKNLSPAAKNMLFRSTGNVQLEQALDDLMFAADRIGGWDKVASTSRSQISGTMMGQAGAIAGVAATADWLTALKFAALDIGGPAAAAWTLTNPKGIRAIANALDKANDAAVGAMRGVMAINPPNMPGRNIPSGRPQEISGGGNQIPKFAEGGVVTQPTVAMIGERGPEAVIPLDDPAAAQQAADVAAARTRQSVQHPGFDVHPGSFYQANESLGLTKQEGDLYKRHLKNLWGPGGVTNPPTADEPQGSRSTLYQTVVEHNGRYYNIPTVRNGRILSEDEAEEAAHAEGIEKFPSYATPQEADDRYINQMHPFMDQDVGEWFKRPQSGLLNESVLSQQPSNMLADADPAIAAQQAREAAVGRQRHAVQPPGGRQQGEFTEGLLDLAIPGRGVVRSLGQGEYGQAAMEAGTSAAPFAGKALGAATAAAPAITKTAGAAVAALTSMFMDSATGKSQLSPESQEKLRFMQQKSKLEQEQRTRDAAQRKQEAEEKASREAQAAELSARTETERQAKLAEIEAGKQREQLKIEQERQESERKVAEESVKANAAENKRLAELPFRERHPDAALKLTLGGIAVAAIIPGASEAYKKWAFNSYVREWEKLDKVASEALLKGAPAEQQLAVNRLAAAAAKKAEQEGKLHEFPWLTQFGSAGAAVEGGLIPSEVDITQPKESEAHKSAVEFFSSPSEWGRLGALYAGGTLAGLTSKEAAGALIPTRKTPSGAEGAIKTYEQQAAARKKAESAAKSAQTRAAKKAKEEAARKEPEKEPRKAKVPRDGPKIYGLREE